MVLEGRIKMLITERTNLAKPGLRLIKSLTWTTLLLCSFRPVCAQATRGPYDGHVEVNGFVGASKGIDRYRVMGGGNISLRATSWLLPYGEFSYFPGIKREFTSSGAISQVVR